MDLNRWTGESYQPKGITALKVTLGANRFRCEYCRLNFASFRKRKEVFSFHRWERIEAERRTAQDAATGGPAPPFTERRRTAPINPDRTRDQG
jgi:hypothetical protein